MPGLPSTLHLLAACLLLPVPWAARAGPAPCAESAQAIPARPEGQAGASAFWALAGTTEGPEREQLIRNALLAGNLPPYLRQLQPVLLQGRQTDGTPVRLRLCVMPDYLAVGSDADYSLMPMALDTALAVADRLGFTLPTSRMVDLIYARAALHLRAQPLPANAQMRSSAYYRLHNAMVSRQRAQASMARGLLSAGHKKDLVLSARLWQLPGHVAIYGWQRDTGAPIQPLSTVHGLHYADYSHGVRLVSKLVFVNDSPRSIYEVLADGELAPLLSSEGPLTGLRNWVEQMLLPAAGAPDGG